MPYARLSTSEFGIFVPNYWHRPNSLAPTKLTESVGVRRPRCGFSGDGGRPPLSCVRQSAASGSMSAPGDDHGAGTARGDSDPTSAPAQTGRVPGPEPCKAEVSTVMDSEAAAAHGMMSWSQELDQKPTSPPSGGNDTENLVRKLQVDGQRWTSGRRAGCGESRCHKSLATSRARHRWKEQLSYQNSRRCRTPIRARTSSRNLIHFIDLLSRDPMIAVATHICPLPLEPARLTQAHLAQTLT